MPRRTSIYGIWTDSQCLERDSADGTVGTRPAPAKPARDAGTPPPLLRAGTVRTFSRFPRPDAATSGAATASERIRMRAALEAPHSSHP
jgi:hypothetical protein